MDKKILTILRSKLSFIWKPGISIIWATVRETLSDECEQQRIEAFVVGQSYQHICY